jgi:hypothetical protein
MPFTNETDAIARFSSIASSGRQNCDRRKHPDTTPTRQLQLLPDSEAKREYAVIAAARKGSVAAVTAKLLEHLGHKSGR